ncbi:MAG: PEP/pyruvate-binding domain-containing protein [Actinomycetota bacterium]
MGVTTTAMDPREVGAKAAGLIDMAAAGYPVPPGVVLPIPVLQALGDDPAALDATVCSALDRLEAITGRGLGDADAPLLVSVRSGAALSMPGMMDTVLNVGMTPTVEAALAASTGDAAFAADTHRRFLTSYAVVVSGASEAEVAELADSAGTAAELSASLVERGCEIPTDPVGQVLGAVGAVVASWDSERARAFRQREGVDNAAGTAVTIQAMVFGNLGADSGTGVAFSRDPSTGRRGAMGDVLVGAQGDDVVHGSARPLPLADMAGLWPAAHAELITAVESLERTYGDLVDVEFTVEGGRLHLLQCRPGRRSHIATLRIAIDMAEDPTFPLDRAAAVSRCRDLLAGWATEHASEDGADDEHVVATGSAASPGCGVGVLATTVESALAHHHAGDAVVLVRAHTSPADVAAIAVAKGVVTSSGGLVSHAALLTRSWSIPCVVGVDKMTVEVDGVRTGGGFLPAGTVVTVDGDRGRLLVGSHLRSGAEPPELAVLKSWADDLAAPGTPIAWHANGAAADDIDVVRTVVLRGRATVDGIAAALGAAAGTVVESADRLRVQGMLVAAAGGWEASAAGREMVEREVAGLVRAHAPAFVALLHEFTAPDHALKELVTEWQLDRTSADTGTLVARLRREVHPRAIRIIAQAARLVPRLYRYAQRLDEALVRLQSGDASFFAHPGVDSYHTIWFELHEELITIAGRTRAAETAAGGA